MKNRICQSSLMVVFLLLMHPDPAQAAFFQGEALDTVANIVSWIAIVVAPVTLIALFWLVHILPEKIAEKKKHPQAKAIQVLCLLSLAFGGLLWPIALLWAYSKPVLYKLAYGTDTVEHDAPGHEKVLVDPAVPVPEPAPAGEVALLRMQIAALEAQLSQQSTVR